MMETDQTTLFYYCGPSSGLVPALKTALAQGGRMSGFEIGEMFSREERWPEMPEPADESAATPDGPLQAAEKEVPF